MFDRVSPSADDNVPPSRPRAWWRSVELNPLSRLMLISVASSIALLALISAAPVPYAVLSPGPVTNTLGDSDGKALITVKDHQTYPTSGALDLTTVRILGGPSRVSLFTLVQGWFDDGIALIPEEQIFPKGQTAEESRQENQLEMVSSQHSATAAALRALNYTVPQHMRVAEVSPDSPAKGQLEPGDVVVSVGGVSVDDGTTLRAELQKVTPGEKAPMVVQRNGRKMAVTPGTAKAQDGGTLLGILVEPVFTYPVDVQISIDNVGGPSAGTMFALGIIDKLTPGELTGGRTVAGTGTITPDGEVGPIGGIRQKLIGAREAGATIFLAPADNCSEVVGRVPEGMSVIRIETLSGARDALEKLSAGGDVASLPTCTG